MRAASRFVALAGLLGLGACHPKPPAASGPAAATTKVTLAVLPAESVSFPRAAKAATESLAAATVSGVDETQVSKVSLEVVQLSIECVEQTVECYEKVGKSLAAKEQAPGRPPGSPLRYTGLARPYVSRGYRMRETWSSGGKVMALRSPDQKSCFIISATA